MRIELIPYYSKDASKEFPFWVKAELNGKTYVNNGESWDEAIAKMRQQLADLLAAPTPPLPFTIEI